MKVLMFGWEFPPHISGGLGTACLGLTKGLSQIDDLEVAFVVPRKWGDEDLPDITFIGADQIPVIQKPIQFGDIKAKLRYYELHSHLIPYLGTAEFEAMKAEKMAEENRFIEVTDEGKVIFNGGYGFSLFQEIDYYALVAEKLARELDFDMIHVHDWMCFRAGMAAKRASGKPLVVHVHSTEFDRCGKSVNPAICTIEKEGLAAADKVIAVSNLTRSIVIRNYGIDPRKVVTVYNAVDAADYSEVAVSKPYNPDKVVTFLGRVTAQKGPGYFIEAASLVSKKIKNVRFIMAGRGDLLDEMKRKASELNLAGFIEFPGFVADEEIGELFLSSDVFVMPSVSEPFGLVALEAMQAGVAVIVSNQSGVAELVKNALKVDFWNAEAMAKAIVRLLDDDPFRNKLAQNGKKEARKLLWKNSAEKIFNAYKSLME
jgi:glycosyltransferase involved in cell wall biosynthesis